MFAAMGRPPGTRIVELVLTPMDTHGHCTGLFIPVQKLLGVHTTVTVGHSRLE